MRNDTTLSSLYRRCTRVGLLRGPGLVLAVASIAALTTVGCKPSSSAGTRRARSSVSQQRQADRSESLLTAAVNDLRNLPSFVNTDLRPPIVILDSTKSLEARQGGEGQDILATLTQQTGRGGGTHQLPVGTGPQRVVPRQPRATRRRHQVLRPVERRKPGGGFSPKSKRWNSRLPRCSTRTRCSSRAASTSPITTPAKIEIYRYVDDRLEEIGHQFGRYVTRRLPPLGWEPSPDQQVLGQVTDWLNQWIRQKPPEHRLATRSVGGAANRRHGRQRGNGQLCSGRGRGPGVPPGAGCHAHGRGDRPRSRHTPRALLPAVRWTASAGGGVAARHFPLGSR